MKTIKYFSIIVLFLLAPLLSLHAQTLTKNDVKVIAPQLGQVLNQLSVKLVQKQNQFDAQDKALNGIVTTMGSIVNTLSVLKNQNLSAQDQLAVNTAVSLLGLQINYISANLDAMVRDRTIFDQVINSTTVILASVSQIIASAI